MQGRILATLFAITVMLVVDAALGQDKPKTRWSSLMNVDLMVDTYANFLVRKYDLTDEQAAFTKEMLHAKANDFMGNNGQEVRDLLDRMFEVRTGGEMEQDELVEWGKRSLPVYQAAKQFIVAGNSEWREILDERQKAIHDGDVKQMEESFATTEDQLQRIVTGDMTVDEFRKPRRQRSADRVAQRPRTQVVSQAEPPVEATSPDDAAAVAESSGGAPPPRPLRPDRNPNIRVQPGADPSNPEPQDHVIAVEPPVDTPAVEAPPAAVVAHGNRNRSNPSSSSPGASRRMQHQPSSTAGPGWESKWDQYVKDFIAKYQLDAAQTQKANDILKDCKDQATRRLARDKSKLEALDAEIAKVSAAKDEKDKEKDKGQKLIELTQQRGKLVEAVDEIFEKQLKPRLEKLPTRAQRRAAEAAGPKSARSVKGEKGDASKAGHTTRLPVRPKRDASAGQTNQPQPPEPQPPVVVEEPPQEGDDGGE